MSDLGPELISGWKTAADWRAAKMDLMIGGDPVPWRRVYSDFYKTRLELRYFNPIKVLQDHGTFSGEGFSIAAIQCSLIEFLEATIQGKAYRHGVPNSQLGAYEYSSSRTMFVGFLKNREPFSNEFQDAAQDFYGGVRCGLLHEARTKNGWRIWAKDSESERIIDYATKRLFRDNFHKAILSFVVSYGESLPVTAGLQEAFIRKLDDLCT